MDGTVGEKNFVLKIVFVLFISLHKNSKKYWFILALFFPVSDRFEDQNMTWQTNLLILQSTLSTSKDYLPFFTASSFLIVCQLFHLLL